MKVVERVHTSGAWCVDGMLDGRIRIFFVPRPGISVITYIYMGGGGFGSWVHVQARRMVHVLICKYRSELEQWARPVRLLDAIG